MTLQVVTHQSGVGLVLSRFFCGGSELVPFREQLSPAPMMSWLHPLVPVTLVGTGLCGSVRDMVRGWGQAG